MRKYIFIVGGVMSGVGKGITCASIGKILQSCGFKVTAIKIDPYVNVDAGTMNPTEHGEVFVLDDGMECDQDMGNYERFLNCSLSGKNYMTTGSIYQSVISRERNLEYKGRCVEVVPHIPLEVINKIDKAAKHEKADIVIIEVGGTVGEYQNILFLEAVRMLTLQKPNDVLLTLVSFIPSQGKEGELKTKPTQYAVRTVNSVGLQPDMIFARAKTNLDNKRKEKIAFHCNVQKNSVISAPDVDSIYNIPVNYEKEGVSKIILKKLKLKPRSCNLRSWKKFVKDVGQAKNSVKIAIIGKYFSTGNYILSDSYISVIEAVHHAAKKVGKRPEITWLNSQEFEKNKNAFKKLSSFDGVIIPGGFGSRGIEGKISVIKYLRKNKIPFLGLCYGMQLAVIEYGRSVAKLRDANTTEINPKTPHPIIDILPEQKEKLKKSDYGGTMRLGAYPAILKKNSIAGNAYDKLRISERHRHRYEVNPEYHKTLKNKGLIFSGLSPDKRLVEIIELPKKIHPFFVATQFHPEFLSRPLTPHPLFIEFIKNASK